MMTLILPIEGMLRVTKERGYTDGDNPIKLGDPRGRPTGSIAPHVHGTLLDLEA